MACCVLRCRRFEQLDLQQTAVADAGLAAVQKMANLKQVGLYGTKVTAAGVAKLQAALPNCKIEVDPAVQAELDKMKVQAKPQAQAPAPVVECPDDAGNKPKPARLLPTRPRQHRLP